MAECLQRTRDFVMDDECTTLVAVCNKMIAQECMDSYFRRQCLGQLSHQAFSSRWLDYFQAYVCLESTLFAMTLHQETYPAID